MKSAHLPRRLLHLLGALALLGGAVLIFSYLSASRPAPEDQPVSERLWTVSSMPAEFQTLAPEIRLYGRLESHSESQLSAAVSAYVAAVTAREGEHVEDKQLLLQLDDRDAALVVAQREAELADINAQIASQQHQHEADLAAFKIDQQLLQLNQRAWQRFQTLKGRNVSSDTQLEEAEQAYRQQQLNLTNRKLAIDNHDVVMQRLQAQRQKTQALLETAQLDLQRTSIRAPFSGRIISVEASPGERVRSGDQLLTLFSTDSLQVRAQIPSVHLDQVRQAQTRVLKARAELDDQPLLLSLERLSANVGTGRAGVDALFAIESNHKDLAIGRLFELHLKLPEQDNVISLPSQALYGTDRIYVIHDERLQPVQVERRGSHRQNGEERLLVSSPLIESGDLILTTQLPNAVTGLKVQQVAR